MKLLDWLMGGDRVAQAQSSLPKRTLAYALEPRFLLDAAAVVTVAEAAADQAAHDAAAHAQTEATHAAKTESAKAVDTVSAQATHVDSAPAVAIAPPADTHAITAAPVEPVAVAATPANTPNTPTRHEVIFIDADVQNYQTLINAMPTDSEVVVLDASRDGFAQMAQYLSGRHDIDAVELISHGEAGGVRAGSVWLTADSLSAHAADLQTIGSALTANGDILIYGCDVAAGSEGQSLIAGISALTGADVAASIDPTGAASKGGNWLLEASQGSIETRPLDLRSYSGLLTAFDDTLSSDPIGGGAHASTFTRTLGGVSYTYTFASQGEGGDMVFDSANGSSNSPSILATSLSFNASTTETITIARTDSAAFTFNSIYINNSGGQTVAVGGYLSGSLVGSAQTDATGAAATLNFGAIKVDQVRLSATDFFNTNFDDFSGDTNPPNASPVATTSGGTTAFTEGNNVTSTPVVVDSGITVIDSDNSTLASGTVSITGNFQSGQDVLAYTNNPATMGNISGSYVSGTGILSLSSAGATATLAQWQSAFRSVTYTDSSDSPNTGNRTVSFVVSDGNSNSSAGTKTVSVASTNDTPIATASGGTTAFTEGNNVTSTPVVIDSGITLSDLDSSTFASGTVSITGNLHTAEDVLAFTNNPATMGNISGSYSSGTGVITLTSAGATATIAQWQAAFRSVTYSDSSDTPNTSNRTISFAVNDGSTSSTATTKTISVASTDDTPVVSNLNGDSVVWAGVGNTVTLDASSNASLTDAEFGALNSGNGDWATASLVVQRSGTAISADILGFNTSGALFTVSGSNLQSGGLTFATFTNSGGALTITYTSSGTAATTALVNDIPQRITYRSDTPSGDATLRFTLSDGTSSTTADVTVASDTIYVTSSTDTATIDITNGVSFSEAIGIAVADVTGSQTIAFSGSLASTSLVIGGVTLSENLTFDMDAASGMSLTTGSINIGGTTLTLSNGAGHTATIASSLGGASGALTKVGAGTVTLSNNNGYTGATTISAGTLAVSTSNAISTGSSVSVSAGATWLLSASQSVGNLSGAGSINLGVSTLSTRLTADSTFSGGISGTGAFNVNQTGAATFALTLSGTNTFTGASTLQNFGWLKLDGDASYSNSSALRVNGNSKLTLLSDQTVGSIASSVSTASLNLGSFTLSAGGDNTNTIVAGAISGTGALTKLGTGTLTLSGTNTYTGITTVSAGSLALVSGTAIADTDAVTVASGATLNVAASETIGSLAGAGSVTLGASTLTTGGNNTSTSFSGGMSGSSGALTKTGSGTFTLSGINSYVGATSVSGGTLSIASDSNLGSGTLTLATNTTLALTGAANVDNAIVLSGNATVTTSANATLAGNITSSGGLTKAGSSSLTLSGTDSFTGATSVSAGTLLVNGTLSGTSGMTVASGATLGGGGSIFASSSTNALTVQGGGTLSPGNGGAGTLTVNGNLSMAPGSTLAIDINTATAGTGYDQVIVNGTVDVSGATLATTHGYTAASGDTYNILLNDAADSITGNFSGLSEGSTLTAGGDSVQLTGSYIGGTGNDFTLTAPTFPSVTSISTVTPDGTYKVGDTITLVVNFSEAVHLSTGTIQLTLETGAVDRAVSYLAGSGTSTLYFNYTVQPGDHSIDLDYTSTTALNANGDTVQSGSFQDAVLTLPTPGASGSLGAGAALVVDGVAPTASIVVADNALTVGETSLVTITFSEAVTGFTNADLTVANGTLTAVTTGDGGTTWTATLTPTATITDATNLVTLDNTGVQDIAGNAGTGTTNSNNYAIDNVRPTASIVVADNSLTVGETSLVTVTFSEAVTGFTNADLTIANGTLTAVTTGDGGTTWTATLTPTASITDATNLVTLDNTGVQDIAGNAGTGTTNSNNYAIDNVRPTASIVVADHSLTVGETSLVTVTFSEAVSGFTTADLTVANGSVSGLSSSDGGITWTATLTPTASITHTSNIITLDNTGVVDLVGNAGTGTTDSNNYAIDTLRPTASIVVADTALAVGETSLVTITFSEAVTGFTTADLSVAHGSVSGLSSSDGGITWTATLTPTTGTTAASNPIALDNTGVQDLAGNIGTGSTQSNNYAIDTVRPTAGIVVADNVLALGETSTVTITFSEAVTGFTTANLNVANGAVSGLTSSDGGITWTATLTPTTGSTAASNLITLDNTGVHDLAGNAGVGTTNSNNYAIDGVRPTAAVVVADSALKAGQTSQVTITFSEAVTGFTSADLTVANGAVSSLASSDGGITWTATLTPTTSTTAASNLIALDNAGVQDLAGNTGTGSTQSNNYAIDTARPTASIVVADNALSLGETSTVTITFSEAVTGFTTADLSVAHGSVSGLSSSDGGITWTATLTPTTNTTAASNLIALDNTGVQDLAGNSGAGVIQSNNYAIDTTRPTASIVIADTALAAGETSTVTITFSEAVTGLTSADLTVANGSISGLASSDGGITWTATLTPTTITTTASNLIALDNTGVHDLAGNSGAGVIQSNNYAIDTTRPTASIVIADTALAAGEASTVTITFSEAVTGFTSADLTVANGAVSGLASSDGGITWTATLTPTTSTTAASNLIALDNAGVRDLAGNTGTGIAQSNNYAIDTARPTASIVVADNALSLGETSTVTITFSEAVTGFTAADLNVASGAVSGLTSSDGGVTWTATLTPTANTTAASNLIALDNTGVQDLAGNSGLGVTHSNNYAIDNVVPTALSLTPQAGANSSIASYTLNFSEAVSGVDASDFTLATTGGVTGSIGGVTAIDSHTYRIDVANITGTGTVQLSLNTSATGISDLFGNPLPSSALAGGVLAVDASVVSLPSLPLPTAPAPLPDTSAATPPVLGTSEITTQPITTAANVLFHGGNDVPLLSNSVSGSLAALPLLSVPGIAHFATGDSIRTGYMPVSDSLLVVFDAPRDMLPNANTAHDILSARLSNGQPLPNWMIFDAHSGTFAATPPKDFTGEIDVQVIVRDHIGREKTARMHLFFNKGVLEKQQVKRGSGDDRHSDRSGAADIDALLGAFATRQLEAKPALLAQTSSTAAPSFAVQLAHADPFQRDAAQLARALAR